MLVDPTDRIERRRRLDRAWEAFVQRGEIDLVRPEIARSWTRTRTLHGVDPAMRQVPVVGEDELLRRREQSDLLEIATPILDEYSSRLREQGHLLAFFDGGGCMLAMGGDPAVVDLVTEANFVPGGLWREDTAGTNAAGTSLTDRRAIEVFASEHYVEAWHEWACAAAPIVLAGASEPLGVIDIIGPWDAPEPQVLLSAAAIASIIEERVRAIQTVRAETIRCAMRCARASGDALVAVDDRGRLLAANDAAHRRLALDPRELPALREKLATLLPRGGEPTEEELTFEWPGAGDPHRKVICATVNHGGRTIGALLRVPAPPAPASVRALRPVSPAHPARAVPAARYGFSDILGASEPLLKAIAHARVAARNDLPVVIHGESGTGKELFAHGIHAESARGGGPFVAVNCGAIPASLIEAELFGYEAGTFTGGQRDGRAGKLEEAHGGTLFLDEVSELSPQAQTALLRVLQESEVVRLGGTAPRAVDVRVLVATNKDLAAEVAAGRFRQDLFFRLHVLTVDIPPLRCRPGDVAILARAFLEEAQERVGRSGLELSEAALEALAAHPWPGNVRELKNAVLRAAAVAPTSRVEPADLHLVDVRPPSAQTPASVAEPPLPQRGGHDVARGPIFDSAGPDPERDELLAALDACGWNIARTSTTLGVSRMTLYRRLRKYGITR